jgi:hypothetical protein
MRRGFLLALGLATAVPALANDTTASTGAGGLVIERTDDIDLVSEDLFVSASEIRIGYVFRNSSPKDVETIVAFPMPDRDLSQEYGEAYSDEVSSAGFWAGGVTAAEPFFYSYIYPEPDGYRAAKVEHGSFDQTFGEFVLPYAKVRASDDPAAMLSEFFQSAYDAGAELARWDRAALEREPVAP